MTNPQPRERSVAKLSRGLVGWSIVGILVASFFAYMSDVTWGEDVVMGAILIAVIAVPVGLVGIALAPRLQSQQAPEDLPTTTERVVSGIAVVVIIALLMASVLAVTALSNL